MPSPCWERPATLSARNYLRFLRSPGLHAIIYFNVQMDVKIAGIFWRLSKMSKSPTMRDVAELAGVSAQTASYVVNHRDVVSSEPRARVLEAIEQLNYRRDP